MRVIRSLRVGLIWTLCLQLLLTPITTAAEVTPQTEINRTPVEAGVFDYETAYLADELVDEAGQGGDDSATDIDMITQEPPPIESQPGIDGGSEIDINEPTENQHLESDEEVPPPAISYPGVMITQVQTTAGTGRTNEDLIELRNNSVEDIDITDWKVLYGTASGISSPGMVALLRPITNDEVGWRLMLPAGSVYLMGTPALLSSNPGLAVDQTFTAAVATSGGRLLIYDVDEKLVSGFAWGSSTVSVEGQPFSPATNVMERRLAEGGLWHQNTRDNKSDFISSGLRPLYEIGQAEEVFDACLNLGGIQPEVMDGWYRSADGMCSDRAPLEPNMCESVMLSEIGANIAEQFIEIHNPTVESIDITGCRLQTNRNDRYFTFDKKILEPGEYMAVLIIGTDLILTKTTSGTVYLLSADGQHEVDSVSYANLRNDTSWSLVDGSWLQTYRMTPGQPNIYQQYLGCEAGYARNTETGRCNRIVLANQPAPCAPNQYRNPETGRCRLLVAASTLAACREGQYRHPETNRCRNLVSAASTLTPCRPGQERNPATNRCRSIASNASTLKPCQDGWERNPDTNRCRKIQTLGSVSDYPVEPIVDVGKGFAAWWALGGVIALGVGYGTWEWRRELAAGLRRVSGMMSK